MKTLRLIGILRMIAATAFFGALGGCAVVPAEPVVYAAPAPAPVVVVRPHAYYGYYPRHRYWR